MSSSHRQVYTKDIPAFDLRSYLPKLCICRYKYWTMQKLPTSDNQRLLQHLHPSLFLVPEPLTPLSSDRCSVHDYCGEKLFFAKAKRKRGVVILVVCGYAEMETLSGRLGVMSLDRDAPSRTVSPGQSSLVLRY